MSVGVYRGLLFMSPFLALGFPGYFLWYVTEPEHRAEILTCLAIPVVFFFAICMYWGANGGQVAGPRYLIELVPFLALPVIFVMDRLREPWGRAAVFALIAISLANTWIETIGGRAFATGGIMNPLFNYNLPQLADGHLPMNLSSFFGLGRGPESMVPLLVGLAAWSAIMSVGLWPRTLTAGAAQRCRAAVEAAK